MFSPHENTTFFCKEKNEKTCPGNKNRFFSLTVFGYCRVCDF